MVFTPGKLAALAAIVALMPQATLGVAVWGQCGGADYNGPAICDSGSTCIYVYQTYSQCQPRNGRTSDRRGGGTTTAPPPPNIATSTSLTTTTNPPTGGNGLDARAKARGKKYFGNIVEPFLLSNAQNSAILKTDFGALTSLHSAMWDAIEPTQGAFAFAGFDAVVKFAQSNGKLVRGHAYLWHAELPSWVSHINSSSTLTNVINNHISTIGKRYAGKIYAWDVVNEIFNDNGSYRSSVFYNVLGASFVPIAFKAARAADPGAKLYINDYHLDNMDWSAPKVNAVANLVRSQLAAGVPIDGIGSQAHLNGGDSSGVAAALSTLVDSGVSEIAITELDVTDALSEDYSAVVKACLGITKCIGITVWGVSDKDSPLWSGTPLLYDSAYRKKAAYGAVLSALS